MALRRTFCLALLAWWSCSNVSAQERAFFGEIRDTVRPHEGGLTVIKRVPLHIESSGIVYPQDALGNEELYLLNKYEHGRYSYSRERNTLYTDFGSYAFATEGKAATWFFFPRRRVLLVTTALTDRIYRQDTTILYRSISERLYTKEFQRPVHGYHVQVPRQGWEKPSLTSFAENLAYSTELWAGAFGLRTVDLVQFNSFEFFRANLPLLYNQRHLRLEQDIGYGYNDKRWKFATLAETGFGVWQFSARVKHEIEEANNYFFEETLSPLEKTRTLYLNRYDWVSEAGVGVRHRGLGLAVKAGALQRKFLFDSTTSTGPFLRMQYELPLAGAYADYSNGHHQVLSAAHYVRLSSYSFWGSGQYVTMVRPVYYFSNAATDAVQVRFIAEGMLTLGKLADRLSPMVSGNGVEFNTVTEGTLESLQPTSLAARRWGGLHLLVSKTVSVSTEIPYQPSLFVAANADRVWQATNLFEAGKPKAVAAATLGEIGFGVRNLFVFPLPVLRPAIGVGYYIGLYPGTVKALDSGSLKFTLRFFN